MPQVRHGICAQQWSLWPQGSQQAFPLWDTLLSSLISAPSCLGESPFLSWLLHCASIGKDLELCVQDLIFQKSMQNNSTNCAMELHPDPSHGSSYTAFPGALSGSWTGSRAAKIQTDAHLGLQCQRLTCCTTVLIPEFWSSSLTIFLWSPQWSHSAPSWSIPSFCWFSNLCSQVTSLWSD